MSNLQFIERKTAYNWNKPKCPSGKNNSANLKDEDFQKRSDRDIDDVCSIENTTSVGVLKGEVLHFMDVLGEVDVEGPSEEREIGM